MRAKATSESTESYSREPPSAQADSAVSQPSWLFAEGELARPARRDLCAGPRDQAAIPIDDPRRETSHSSSRRARAQQSISACVCGNIKLFRACTGRVTTFPSAKLHRVNTRSRPVAMLARLPAPSASSQLIQCHLRLRIPVTRRCAFTFRRSYVTPGRPKGVVGEASKPVKRSTTTTKKAPSKTSTTAATKAKAAAAKKKQADAVKKEKAAAAKKKAAAKVKAAAAKKKAAAAKKAKKPVKATLTPEQKAKQTAKKEQAKQRVKLSELKAKALLGEPQKPYSVSAWSIFFAELHQKRSRTTLQESINVTRDAAKEFKTFTPEEREVSQAPGSHSLLSY